MNERYIVSKITAYLHTATKELCAWLERMLPRVSDNWWQECVISNLSYAQQMQAEENGYSKLEQFDLAALLRNRALESMPTVNDCVHLTA